MIGSEILIVPVFFLSFFGMIFGIVYTRNKENMAMIDRGLNPRQNNRKLRRAFWPLRFGLLFSGVGLGILVAFLIDQLLLNHRGLSADGDVYDKQFPQIYFAMITLCGGIGLVLSNLVEKKELHEADLMKKVDG